MSTINDTKGLPKTLHCRSVAVNDAMYESTELLNKSFNVWWDRSIDRHKFVEVVVFLSVCPTHCWSVCVCIPYKVGTDTSSVQVLLKILYFSGMISHWIWYSENYWLAHNFPHICPSRPQCWLLSLCPTTFRLTLSNKAEEYDDNSRSFSPKSHADSWIRIKCPDQNYQ